MGDNGHEDFVEVVNPEDGLDDIGDVGLLQNGGFAKSEPKNVMPDADGDVVDLTGDDLGDGVVDGPEENGMDVFDDELNNDGMDDMNDDFEDDEFDNDGMGDEDMNDEFEDDEFDNDDNMDDEFDGDDFGDDDVDFYDDQMPNEGDYNGDSEWTPDENDGDFDGDFGDDGEWNPDENDGDFDSNYMNDGGDNDEFYGDYGNKDYAGNDWMTLFAVFSFGWFLCGSSLLLWSCYYWRKQSNAKVQWQKVDMIDEGMANEENEHMIAVN